MIRTEIYVKLLNEDVEVYRPVKAQHIRDNIFKIIDKNSEIAEKYGERWEFNEGEIVVCKYHDDVYKAAEKFSGNI